MNLIFDTSVLIDLERGDKATIAKIKELKEIYPSPAEISFMTYFEFIYGLRNKSIKNRDKFRAFVEKFNVLQTTKNTAEILSMLHEKYNIPIADLFIASQTLENNGVLVTKDQDFKEIQEINKIVL